MDRWTSNELDKIGTAEELEIAPLRSDGTMRKPTTIWVVRVGNDLYVRSAYGSSSGWFRGAQVRHEGRIRAGGVEKDVTFVDADPGLNNQIDEAYRKKYRQYAATYVEPMVSAQVRATTIRLLPSVGRALASPT